MAFGGTLFLHPGKGALNRGDGKRLDGWKHFMFPRDYDIVRNIEAPRPEGRSFPEGYYSLIGCPLTHPKGWASRARAGQH